MSPKTTLAEDRNAPRHPIAVVSERTGLSQDVLRVWERRYAAVTPTRDAAGQRLYSDADVARLSFLLAVTRAGRSIGQVASLPTPALAALVEEDAAARDAVRQRELERAPAVAGGPFGRAPSVEIDDVLNSSLALARTLDASALDAALRRIAAHIGISAFIESVAAPLLRRVGDEWHAGRMTPAQEHLVSVAVHDIAGATLRELTPPIGAPRLLVTTPSGDRHAIGAMLVGAAAALEGWNVLYLGADLPAAEIASAAIASRARVVALSVVYMEHPERVVDELRALRAALPADVAVLAGGSGARVVAAELHALGVRVESSIPGLVAELRREQAAA